MRTRVAIGVGSWNTSLSDLARKVRVRDTHDAATEQYDSVDNRRLTIMSNQTMGNRLPTEQHHDRLAEATDDLQEKAAAMKESVQEKAGELKDAVKEGAGEVWGSVKDVGTQAK